MATPMLRILSGVVFWTWLVIVTLVGGAIGLFYNATTDVIYESRAVFQIAPDWTVVLGDSDTDADQLLKVCELRHDELIGSPEQIASCLESNNLFVLDGFVDLSKDDCVDLIFRNLRSSQLADGSGVYELILRSANPQDSATVLNNLIKSYHEKLDIEYPDFKEQCSFVNLEVGRVGEQVYPILKRSYSQGLCAGFVLAALLWFMVNPFKLQPSRVAWWQWLLGMLAGCVACGGIVIWWMSVELPYVSEAQISILVDESKLLEKGIDSRLGSLIQEPHNVLFRQYSIIERACEKNGNQLFVLDIFVDHSKEEVINEIKDKLEVRLDEGNPTTLNIRFHARDREDCQLVLQALASHYVKSLEARYRRGAGSQESIDEDSGIVKVEIVQPASEAESVFQKRKWGSEFRPSGFRSGPSFPYILLAMPAGLLPLAIWFTWLATRDHQAISST